ncbi:MAG: hypothetical protein H6Q73_3686 [Firmicutes bacterium]|nr:hypothetical protein [Bacillota bacterium]
MKRYMLLFAAIVLVVALPAIIWWFKPEVPLNVVILDKTVPVNNYREHKALMWLLNNLKYVNSKTGVAFSYDKDYYGFFPLENKTYVIRKLPDDVHEADVIYVTDTYGVYSEDYFGENLKGNRSELIYGGLTTDEVSSIQSSLNNRNILIAEFNTLASPSTDEARSRMEELLGVKWTGWIGRYFDDLSSANRELPLWLVHNYEQQYLVAWSFSGPGFAFINKDDGVVILQMGKAAGERLNRIYFTPEALAHYKVKNGVEYSYWFDVVEAAQDAEVLAEYHLDVTEEGAKILKNSGLPNAFPAIVKRFGKYRTYYFAGDFADNNNIQESWKVTVWRPKLGIDALVRQDKLYWQVYFPFMEKVLEEVRYK